MFKKILIFVFFTVSLVFADDYCDGFTKGFVDAMIVEVARDRFNEIVMPKCPPVYDGKDKYYDGYNLGHAYAQYLIWKNRLYDGAKNGKTKQGT